MLRYLKRKLKEMN